LKKSYPRSSRVGDLIKQEVAGLLLTSVNDPRVAGVTITDVRLTEDLEHAKIFFVVRNPETKQDALKGLTSAKGYIKKHLASAIVLRKFPEITFFYDDVFENGVKFDNVLRGIKEGSSK
jgi:ribosome-binding factor A